VWRQRPQVWRQRLRRRRLRLHVWWQCLQGWGLRLPKLLLLLLLLHQQRALLLSWPRRLGR
jgi:hypothetical protein